MSMASEQLIILCMLLPLVAAVLIVLANKHPNLREAITLITASAVAVMVITLARRVMAGEVPSCICSKSYPASKSALPLNRSACCLRWLPALCVSNLGVRHRLHAWPP